MKLRYVQFLHQQKVDLPSQSQSSDMRDCDWDLDYSPQLGLLRYKTKRPEQVGRWCNDDGQPIYGMAPIGYVPRERILRMEPFEDAADAAPEAEPKGPAKKQG